jgi:hypothetical protein
MKADPLGLIFWCFMNKVAILIDAEFLLKRLPSVCPSVDHKSARAVANAISRLVTGHLKDQKKYMVKQLNVPCFTEYFITMRGPTWVKHNNQFPNCQLITPRQIKRSLERSYLTSYGSAQTQPYGLVMSEEKGTGF